MVPAGYMSKRIASRPEWLAVTDVHDIYSVSNCISDDFADYSNCWKHNGYWLFDSPEVIAEVAETVGASLEGAKLFYYEVYEQEYDQGSGRWSSFSPEAAFQTEVATPVAKNIEGYDVVNFYAHTSPECSPLSCNNLAGTVRVNEHCLFPTFEDAVAAIETGKFKEGEPGLLRVFAVYSIVES